MNCKSFSSFLQKVFHSFAGNYLIAAAVPRNSSSAVVVAALNCIKMAQQTKPQVDEGGEELAPTRPPVAD